MDSSSDPLSTVSGPQQNVQNLLGKAFSGFLGPKFQKQGSDALQQLLAGIPQDVSAISEGAFRDFREFAIPSINLSASGISGTQNSRRVGEIARAAGSLTSQLARVRAQFIDNARNRQQSTIFGLLNSASGFANAGGTVENIVTESPLGPILGIVGGIAGGIVGGPPGAIAGAAIGSQVGGGGP